MTRPWWRMARARPGRASSRSAYWLGPLPAIRGFVRRFLAGPERGQSQAADRLRGEVRGGEATTTGSSLRCRRGRSRRRGAGLGLFIAVETSRLEVAAEPRRDRPRLVPVPDRGRADIVGAMVLREAFFGHVAHEAAASSSTGGGRARLGGTDRCRCCCSRAVGWISCHHSPVRRGDALPSAPNGLHARRRIGVALDRHCLLVVQLRPGPDPAGRDLSSSDVLAPTTPSVVGRGPWKPLPRSAMASLWR